MSCPHTNQVSNRYPNNDGTITVIVTCGDCGALLGEHLEG